ncbi:MAG: glycosyltransferase family 2 protein [Actinobacteria bacterium]|nr:glycosyltransferase family 2 protein [Actinomycetota bacterium]
MTSLKRTIENTIEKNNVEIYDRRAVKTTQMKKITVVIPALNEEKGIGRVLDEIPKDELKKMGYETEVMVIDNGSKDKTKYVANNHGAKVIVQPIRGYGNAYKAGFANAEGDIIATGDADLTYPFSILPQLLRKMEMENLDFINTNRLKTVNTEVMSRSHIFGNYVLTFMMKVLFRTPFLDSQSGMWLFKSGIWDKLNVVSSGMPFSQEIKIEAFTKGFKCSEVPIQYRDRAGKQKLNTIKDGIGNLSHLIFKKLEIFLKVITEGSRSRGYINQPGYLGKEQA